MKSKSLDVNSWLAEARKHIHDHHDTEIKTYTIVRTEPIRAVALTLFLEALAEHCGADLLRLKGIVNIAESPDRPARDPRRTARLPCACLARALAVRMIGAAEWFSSRAASRTMGRGAA